MNCNACQSVHGHTNVNFKSHDKLRITEQQIIANVQNVCLWLWYIITGKTISSLISRFINDALLDSSACFNKTLHGSADRHPATNTFMHDSTYPQDWGRDSEILGKEHLLWRVAPLMVNLLTFKAYITDVLNVDTWNSVAVFCKCMQVTTREKYSRQNAVWQSYCENKKVQFCTPRPRLARHTYIHTYIYNNYMYIYTFIWPWPLSSIIVAVQFSTRLIFSIVYHKIPFCHHM